jgi:hypothetical protein
MLNCDETAPSSSPRPTQVVDGVSGVFAVEDLISKYGANPYEG